jgi:glycosyltransferase involved in cell wall biosynthesis
MKIAVDCRMIGTGGIGSYISELIPFFTRRYDCLLIGTAAECQQFQNTAHTRFISCQIQPFSLAELFYFPSDCLKEINACDIYYTPYCNIPGGIRIPVCSTIHDIVFLDIPGLSSRVGTAARRFLYQRAIKRSKILFTVSNFSRERIHTHLHCTIPIVVTYNAAPAYLAEPFKIQPEKTNTILFVGNIKKHKGLKTLLDAFTLACAAGCTARLVIVGNADNFRTGDEETVKRINSMSSERISFTGRISDETLKTLYAQAALLVQPSDYEGFGMPPLEALSVGTPVLLSDIPVFREIYHDFPVTYFASGDSRDLAEKLTQCLTGPRKIIKIPQVYSFERTASVIFQTLDTLKMNLK